MEKNVGNSFVFLQSRKGEEKQNTNIMIMNRLAIFRRVATLLFLMLTSVTLWGQEPEEPIKLLQILDVEDFYQYTENVAITFSYTINDEDSHVVTEYIDAVIKDKEGNTVSPTEIKNKNKYTLTVTGDDIHYTGTLIKEFYVWDTTLSGGGTEGSPYMINTEDDWIKLAASLYLAEDDNPSYGKFYELGANLSVETMVGNVYTPFRGSFNGNSDTLTFNKGAYADRFEDATDPYCAPFRYTDGATIHDIVVNGSIYTKVGGAGGLIGYNDNSDNITTVEDVVVGVNIFNDEDENFDGGVAAYGFGVSFKNCVYNGKLDSFSWGGGFTPYGDEYTHAEDCLFNPDPDSKSWGENFISYDYYGDPYQYSGNIVRCYYTKQTSLSYNWGDVLSTQGISAYSPLTPGNIGHHEKTILGNEIYTTVDIEISGIEEDYIYTGNNITIAFSVTSNGGDAIPEKCSAVITDSNGDVLVDEDGNPVYYVKDIGTYNFVVVGNEENKYYGSKIKTFSVISCAEYGNWSDLQALLDGNANPIELDIDYRGSSSDAVLTINRNVTINMNGHTIDRHLSTAQENGWVIKIPSDKTVTINDGTITGGYNKAASNSEANDNDGGGINNMENLTLNNVTVTANKVVKRIAGSEHYTARGGGIYCGPGSSFTMIGGSVSGNAAEGGGGGLFGKNASSFYMSHVNISGNECLDKGGGIRITGSATLNHCDVRNNVLRTKNVSDGGGVYYGGGGTFRLNDCKIRGNQATKQGGGFFTLGGTTYFKNCDIVDNFAFDYDDIGNSNYGGGICMLGGTIYMDSVAVVGNISRQDGCGIYVKEGGAKLHLTGYINIFDNFLTRTIASHGENNNVYLANSGGVINVQEGFNSLSYIGVIKNGNSAFTNGLGANGSIANFASDRQDLYVIPDGNEAKMGTLSPFPVGENVTVNGPMVIDDRTSTEEITISGDGILYIVNSGYVDAVVHNEEDETRLIIEDGGQVIIREDPLDPEPVPATIKKNIKDGVWYLISSAMANPKIIENTNLITEHSTGFPSNDLYRFNESTENTNPETGLVLQWENYRNEVYHGENPANPFEVMTNGRGYLYRNFYDHTITINGNLNTGTVVGYTLTYTATILGNANVFPGFNIIGNPYPHNIKKGTDQAIPNTYLEDNYYNLLANGTWHLETDGTEISPLTGILVQAKSSANGQTLTLYDIPVTTPTPEESKSGDKAITDNIWFTVANGTFEDRACVEFKEGHGLNKMAHPNEEAPMLYIRHNGEDFASVDLNPDTKAFNLNFKSMTMSMYTLTMKAQGNYRYIRLIDKIADTEIDMLAEGEYTFISTTADMEDRFVVRLGDAATDSEEVFAYQSGNDIVVSGTGELQVFDVMGRFVMSRNVNGYECIGTSMLKTGVYILRIVGDQVKTQKIVVR